MVKDPPPGADIVFVCDECEDIGYVSFVREDGSSAARACVCREEKIKKARFLEAIDKTPPKFRERHGVIDGFRSIKPNPQVHPRQPEVLSYLSSAPDNSFWIYGRTGAHKTTFAWALLQEAGRVGRMIGGNTGRNLIDTLRNYELHQRVSSKHSFYSIEQLEEKGRRFHILIDDIDGIRISEYTCELIWELLEKIQTFEHRLIVTSNRSIDETLADWVRRDVDGRANARNYVEKIIRRFKELCQIVDLT